MYYLAMVGAAFALALVTNTADATMLGGAKAVNDTAVETGIIEQVHGCHRRCVRGPRGRLHRHVGPFCRRVACPE